MAEKTDIITRPSYNGVPIPLWSETIKEYHVMERFPQLKKRFESGLHCLTLRGTISHVFMNYV